VHRAVAVSGTTPEFQRFPIVSKVLEAKKNYGVEGLDLDVGLGIVMGESSGIGIRSSMGMASMVVGVVEVPSHGVRKQVEAQKVYVGSYNVTQAQFYAIFLQFRELEKVVLQADMSHGMTERKDVLAKLSSF